MFFVSVGLFSKNKIVLSVSEQNTMLTSKWRFFFFVSTTFAFFFEETGAINLNVIRLFRFCRIFRLLRLLKHAKRIRILFLTLVYASSSLLNVGILLFVIFFIYAVIGISVFGEKACGFQPDTEPDEAESEQCAENGDKANFSSFSLALSLLYRVATEDGWSDLYDQYVTPSDRTLWSLIENFWKSVLSLSIF